MKNTSWIVLSYKVPSEPSTMRVRVWRNLKALGVVYIQQSVCVAPDTSEVRKKIQQIKKSIDSINGETLLLEVVQFSENTEEHIIELFNQQRTKEYEEFLDGCDLFLKEMESETQKQNFTFHEVEENEADLGKLKRWFRKIMKRDFFQSPLEIRAKSQLDLCESKLAQFTDQVYQSEGQKEGEILNEEN
ncbi:Chromate resistance protein ChrB [Paenibacillus elgii]|uniref:Chromate resistance protein ChrB n=1 Tax=Paenibacillus elgii TaxID=189691 RepID=UPI000248DBB4|nr:Chromate resistance protein ChrB [Paenibacillus elgii]